MLLMMLLLMMLVLCSPMAEASSARGLSLRVFCILCACTRGCVS